MLRPTCALLLGLVAPAHTALEGFIVGGEMADINKHAHSAFLQIVCVTNDAEKPRSWICCGSILNQKILLTAGHCLYGCTPLSRVKINLGDEHKDRGQINSMHSFMIHEEYNPQKNKNDICLVKVRNPLTLGKTVRRVALLRKPPYNEWGMVAGWGLINENEQFHPELLRFVKQKVLNSDECLRVLGYLEEGNLCVDAGKKRGDYASLGDSGSALIVRGYIQIGLVSYKVPSISKNTVVYTDVGHFYNWIVTNARQLYCNK